jgi:hypothetical protein
MNCQYCSRECKNANSLRNHERLCKFNPNHQISEMNEALAAARVKKSCRHCNKEVATHSINRHESGCKSNPKNQKECPVCKTMHGKNGVTCSYSCSNTLFRSGSDNPNWKEENYRTTCWEHHEKKCIICSEEKIVAVHHYDLNHDNNESENLVPLCPTHHQYVHSRYSYEVQPQVDEYVKQFKLRFA